MLGQWRRWGSRRWWANINSGCVSGGTLIYTSRTLIYTLVYCLHEPLIRLCVLYFLADYGAHLLLINLPPRRKTAPPLLVVTCYVSWAAGSEEMGCMHTCILGCTCNAFILTVTYTQQTIPLNQKSWSNIGLMLHHCLRRWHDNNQCLINHVYLDVDVRLG